MSVEHSDAIGAGGCHVEDLVEDRGRSGFPFELRFLLLFQISNVVVKILLDVFVPMLQSAISGFGEISLRFLASLFSTLLEISFVYYLIASKR